LWASYGRPGATVLSVFFFLCVCFYWELRRKRVMYGALYNQDFTSVPSFMRSCGRPVDVAAAWAPFPCAGRQPATGLPVAVVEGDALGGQRRRCRFGSVPTAIASARSGPGLASLAAVIPIGRCLCRGDGTSGSAGASCARWVVNREGVTGEGGGWAVCGPHKTLGRFRCACA